MRKNKTDTRNVRIRQDRKSSIKPSLSNRPPLFRGGMLIGPPSLLSPLLPPPPILVLIYHKKNQRLTWTDQLCFNSGWKFILFFIFQTIASWLSLGDSTWQTIPAVISFDLQSHWPHWILYFFGQVLKPNFLICKDISHIRRIKLLLLRKNNHKRSQILALRPLSFFFIMGPFCNIESSELAA